MVSHPPVLPPAMDAVVVFGCIVLCLLSGIIIIYIGSFVFVVIDCSLKERCICQLRSDSSWLLQLSIDHPYAIAPAEIQR